jgi:preprotein translocase SecE subunit
VVARDRQRAKQRRAKRQPGTGGTRSTRDVERELGLGGDEAVDSPLGEGTAAPNPLDHASADVDLARLAEAGAPLPDDDEDELGGSRAARAREDELALREEEEELGLREDDDELALRDEQDELGLRDEEDDDFERAPDEAEGDAPVPLRRGRTEHAPARSRGRLLTFLGHCIDELRRVQWPDRRHVGQATAVVLGFVLLAGGYLGLLDAIWRPLVEAIL